MSFSRKRIPYPAADDYGSRKGYPTLAVVYHMAEGTNVAQYLSRNPLRGVSVHYTIEQQTDRWDDGEVVRCLPEDRISGSLNPNTIRTDDDRFYGARHARAVLGRFHSNPNVAVITVEVAGRAKDGPTKAQRDSMVALFDDIRRRHPKVAPLGHRDFQNVKPCPGTTIRMKAAFKGMGGHGADHEKPETLRQKVRRLRRERDAARADVEQMTERRDRLRETNDDLEASLAATRAEADALREELDAVDRDPENARAAGWESALVAVEEKVGDLRTEGP